MYYFFPAFGNNTKLILNPGNFLHLLRNFGPKLSCPWYCHLCNKCHAGLLCCLSACAVLQIGTIYKNIKITYTGNCYMLFGIYLLRTWYWYFCWPFRQPVTVPQCVHPLSSCTSFFQPTLSPLVLNPWPCQHWIKNPDALLSGSSGIIISHISNLQQLSYVSIENGVALPCACSQFGAPVCTGPDSLEQQNRMAKVYDKELVG